MTARKTGTKFPYLRKSVANHITKFARYYDELIQYRPMEHSGGELLAEIDSPNKRIVPEGSPLESLEPGRRAAILLDGTLNYALDVQAILSGIRPSLTRESRLVAVLYNPYLRLVYQAANAIGMRTAPLPRTFLTRQDLQTLARLSGYEVVDYALCAYSPWKLAGVGALMNSICSVLPVVRWLALSCVATLRPSMGSPEKPGLTVVIPARNEFGNIESALLRMPDFGCPLEIIFVEGHSSDSTWTEILRVKEAYAGKFRILACRQQGKGKADAVRLGFSKAAMPLLTILDADLTMPPEMLVRFYTAYTEGYGDFINGSRLLYPMGEEAMRFLNHLGNIFFAKSLSYVLNTPISDSLCGTKLLTRADYERMTRWRRDFGDFDPFGDFELLFPAAVLHLGVINVPIRYAERTYGSTNISRFRDGFQLLRMTIIGFFRIRCGL